MSPLKKITANDTEISVLLKPGEEDYISLTDMARFKDNDPFAVIGHWMRNRGTIEYLGVWETLHNPNFKPAEFGRFMEEAGFNAFTMSPKKWIESTNAIGIISKAGRYGGTFAHKDIAFSFGMWLSPTFQLYVVKEYQQLKERESDLLPRQWDVKRILSKTNYHLHTEAIKDNIIPHLSISKAKEHIIYASEADMLNMALFGYTAKDWEKANPELAQRFNMRDTATINQLIVLSNMEAYNSEMIKHNVPRDVRFGVLHRMAKEQLRSLNVNNAEQKFKKLQGNETNVFLPEKEKE